MLAWMEMILSSWGQSCHLQLQEGGRTPAPGEAVCTDGAAAVAKDGQGDTTEVPVVSKTGKRTAGNKADSAQAPLCT